MVTPGLTSLRWAPMLFSTISPSCRPRSTSSDWGRRQLHKQFLVLQPVIKMGHVFAIAVPFQRRHPLVGAEDALSRLAPARVRHLRVDVGPKAVFVTAHG